MRFKNRKDVHDLGSLGTSSKLTSVGFGPELPMKQWEKTDE